VDVRVKVWRHLLPRVDLFYAVKTNNDSRILARCHKNATGFDAASRAEMESVLKLGVNPEKIIFANPVKNTNDIMAAKKYGIKKMTFDCVEELQKIKSIFPKAECVLRIATDASDTTALHNLSEKFGAPMSQVEDILQLAKKIEMRIKGIAFHTGSGGVTQKAYNAQIQKARKIFDRALEIGLPEMDFLDIGGGFTMVHKDQEKNFNFVAPIISSLLDQYFPDPKVQIIGEPGRYVAESVQYMASMIMGQRTLDGGVKHYYLNNGVYQGYCTQLLQEEQFLSPLDKAIEKREKTLTCFWGQTCDSIDYVFKNKMCPIYNTGEWVFSWDHGAYNQVMACAFNGFKVGNVFYYNK